MIRPDWTVHKNIHDKIDLSYNVCYDAQVINQINSLIQNTSIDFRSYPDEAKAYDILSSFYNKSAYNITIGQGLSELISRVLQIFRNKKIHIISPTWAPVKALCDSYHIESSTVDGDVLYLANPNGRTGKLLERNQVLHLCKKYEYVIADEAYHDFSQEDSSILNQPENLIVLKTLSKSISTAGIRCGYAFANKNITTKLQEIRPAYVTNSLVISFLEDFLNMIEPHTERMISTRAYLEHEYWCRKSYANFVLLFIIIYNLSILFYK